jgi:translation initiation factor IF-3
VNDRIRVPKVRLVDADGSAVGIVDTEAALARAVEQDLDLVEVAPQADPPVCKIMDYGKFKYEQDVRQKEARKKQSLIVVKEMKMRPKIDPHDYETKKGHVVRFLRQGAKVKVTIMFRGREMAHQDLGRKLLDRLSNDLEEIARIDAYPKVDGRNMTMVLGPYKEAITQKQPSGTPRQKRLEERQPQTETAPAAKPAAKPTEKPTEKPAEKPTEKPVEKPAAKKPPKVTRAEGG